MVVSGSHRPNAKHQLSEACSTRPSPKPRNPRPTWSPTINQIRHNCSGDFLLLYCMNGGTCVKMVIDDSISYSCDCKMGYFGARCEYLDTSDRYLAVQQRIETASIAGGVTVLIIIIVFVTVVLYIHFRQKSTVKRMTSERCSSASCSRDRYLVKPFSADFTNPSHPGFSRSSDVPVVVDTAVGSV
ncbi:unnamed protein product [Soboliphyme baturini]|uniref:EGF-like domain-containing protein n=1 Tax=Soboliphyme baturini TaxID=241478 RepID=A0A183INN4_9BILA|nr:unnamed protein product [Soboliphyme baturini]